jgi:hypothetical protein
VKRWARAGHLASHRYNDKGQRLYDRPTALHRPCDWCGGPIPARPLLRTGKKWCSQRCCSAAYQARKQVAAAAKQTGGGV